jgi:hypothetical protein
MYQGGSTCALTQGFKFRCGFLELRDHFTVLAPRASQLVRFPWCNSLEGSTDGFVFRLHTLVASLQPIEPIPKG